MKKITLFLTVAALFSVFCKKSESQKLKTHLDSVSYALGVNIGESMQKQNEKNFDAELIKKGYQSMFDNNPKIKPDDALKILQDYFTKKEEAKSQENLKKGNDFLEKNKKEKDIITLASGLQYKILKIGNGAVPKDSDKVTVNYTGRLIDGTVFETTDGQEPVSFPVNGVIQGWTQALELMPVGSKWTIYLPTSLAYGENPQPGGQIEPNMALIFDIELISIDK
jgi:FKBP-type peptidyl-prolyl cis-trans isomerase FklB